MGLSGLRPGARASRPQSRACPLPSRADCATLFAVSPRPLGNGGAQDPPRPPLHAEMEHVKPPPERRGALPPDASFAAMYSIRLPIIRRAIARRDSARSILVAGDESPRAALDGGGISHKRSFLAAALKPRPSTLAIPKLKAASALDCGLDRWACAFGFLRSAGTIRTVGLRSGHPLDLWRSNHGATASASQPFLESLSKSAARQAIYGRGLGQARLWRANPLMHAERSENVHV